MLKSTKINGEILLFKYLELGLSLFLIFSLVSNFAINKTIVNYGYNIDFLKNLTFQHHHTGLF